MRGTLRSRGPRSDPKWQTPYTTEELIEWLDTVLDVRVPGGIVPGSDPPLAYLVHTFFEGRPPPGDPTPTETAIAGPAARLIQPHAHSADCVLWANRGGGKTFLGAVATVLDLVFKPGIQVRILGGSLEQSMRMHRYLRVFFEREALRDQLADRLALTDRRVRLANKSSAEVLAASQTSVRGTRVQKVRCDEVDLFDRDVWEAAQLTTRSLPTSGPWGDEVRGSVEALSTMHRPLGLMWEIVQQASGQIANEQIANGKEGGRRLFRWGVVDVLGVCGKEHACETCELHPECQGRAKTRDKAGGGAGHLSVADAVAMKRRVGVEAWESEMLCLRPRRSDAVYPEFDPALHVIDGDGATEGTVPVCGMDFGFRAETVVLFALLGEDGVLRVVEERARKESRLESHIAAIRSSRWGVPAWIGVDPAGNQRSDRSGMGNIQAMRQAGLVTRWRRSMLHEGIGLVRARLRPAAGPARLFVHRRCVKLIESLQRYRYPEDRPESLTPLKDGFDHAADALRYLVVNLDRPYRGEKGRYM